MIELPEPATLVDPTAKVKVSFLVGEQGDCAIARAPDDWLTAASRDFDAYVAKEVGVRTRWGVPSTVWWYVSGDFYLGSLVLRHSLNADLAEVGGHVGYNVTTPFRRQGHATRMLAEGLGRARAMGLNRLLLTCGVANVASQRVILANGGRADGRRGNDVRFWIEL